MFLRDHLSHAAQVLRSIRADHQKLAVVERVDVVAVDPRPRRDVRGVRVDRRRRLEATGVHEGVARHVHEMARPWRQPRQLVSVRLGSRGVGACLQQVNVQVYRPLVVRVRRQHTLQHLPPHHVVRFVSAKRTSLRCDKQRSVGAHLPHFLRPWLERAAQRGPPFFVVIPGHRVHQGVGEEALDV